MGKVRWDDAAETDKDYRLVYCCLEVASTCGPAMLVHDLIVIYASYIKKDDFVYRAMVTASDKDGCHSVVSNKHTTSPPPHEVVCSITAKLGRKDYRGIVIDVSYPVCLLLCLINSSSIQSVLARDC